MPKLTLLFKGQSLSVHHLEEGSTLIGRDPECDIVIDSLAVALQHAEVITEAERCRIKGLDEANPVVVNNMPIKETRLNHGDLLRMGKHSLTFATDGYSMGAEGDNHGAAAAVPAKVPDRPTKEAASTGHLQILSGENIGRIIPLNRNMIRLGKAGGDCAVIVQRASGYYISRLEGSMPTVDGVPIGDESVLLTEGSNIRIGGTELQFYL